MLIRDILFSIKNNKQSNQIFITGVSYIFAIKD